MEKTGHKVVFLVQSDQSLAGLDLMIVGDIEELGCWNPAHGLALINDPRPSSQWVGTTTLSEARPFEFKLVARGFGGSILIWENVDNRDVYIGEEESACVVTAQWNNPETWWCDQVSTLLPNREVPKGQWQVTLVLPYWRTSLDEHACLVWREGKEVMRSDAVYDVLLGNYQAVIQLPKNIKKIKAQWEVTNSTGSRKNPERELHLMSSCLYFPWNSDDPRAGKPYDEGNKGGTEEDSDMGDYTGFARRLSRLLDLRELQALNTCPK